MVRDECAKYPNAEIQWVQEEHKNYGYWQHVQPRIETSTGKTRRATQVKIVFMILSDGHVEIKAIFSPKNYFLFLRFVLVLTLMRRQINFLLYGQSGKLFWVGRQNNSNSIPKCQG